MVRIMNESSSQQQSGPHGQGGVPGERRDSAPRSAARAPLVGGRLPTAETEALVDMARAGARRMAAAVGALGAAEMLIAVGLTWFGAMLMSRAVGFWHSHHPLSGYLDWGWKHRQDPHALLRLFTSPAVGHAALDVVIALPIGAIGLAVLITGVEGLAKTGGRAIRRWRAAESIDR